MQAYVLTNWQPVSENRMFSNVLAIHINQPTKKGKTQGPGLFFLIMMLMNFHQWTWGRFFNMGTQTLWDMLMTAYLEVCSSL